MSDCIKLWQPFYLPAVELAQLVFELDVGEEDGKDSDHCNNINKFCQILPNLRIINWDQGGKKSGVFLNSDQLLKYINKKARLVVVPALVGTNVVDHEGGGD